MISFEPFDDKYTAPLHGFKDAADYYRRCSSAQLSDSISVPTLLVQAQDDPFLSASCYPVAGRLKAVTVSFLKFLISAGMWVLWGAGWNGTTGRKNAP